MIELYVLDASGHLTLTWNPDDASDVARAAADIERLRAAGYSFFSTSGATVEQVEQGQGHLIVRRVERVLEVLTQAAAESSPPAKHKHSAKKPKDKRFVAVKPLVGG